MKKSALIILLIAAFSSAVVVMVELGIRSAVLSPFILLDSKKEEGVQKVLTGYSIYQGDYLLDIQNNTTATGEQPLAFHIGNTVYGFSEIHTENVALLAGDEWKVMTRRGIDAEIGHDAKIQSSDRKFFFNEYTIRAPENNASFSLHLKPEFSRPLILFIYLGSFLLPCLLALFFNQVLSMRNLFSLFFPFILAGILPLLLNYHFTMGYALLLTDSYIWSILLCIFVPSFLSVSFATAVYQYTVKSDGDSDENEEMKETGFLAFTRRETIGLSLLVAGGLAYFFSFFLLPLSVYVKITDKWYLFILWYLSLTLVIMAVYTVLHRFMGNYANVGLTEPFASLKNSIEDTCKTKVSLFMKQDSEHETNAWVYSAPFTSRKGVRIYMTEGLMKNFTLDEIKAVLFHEIGHIKLKHGRWILAITFGVAIAVSLIMFFARKIMLGFGWWHYIFIFPIGVIILMLLTEWLPNKISKMFEHQADEYAVRQSGDKDLYIRTLVKLNRISEKEDGEFASRRKEWKETHPSFQKRINFIKDMT
ncbi:M48 family metalloprotease [Kroppenstedtia eburnea]|uniref:M48 family metalloprotease n=1 Tax=Kroppenstedtia eburnea TaxID=714067 RepID=UPI00363B5F51